MDTVPNDVELKDVRIPPYSKEAEDGVLGSLLVDNGTMDLIAGRIKADDFYDYGNRLIFQAIFDLISAGRPADVITVFDVLKEKGHELDTGGFEYLNRLADFTPGSANIIRYTEMIRDRAIRRRLISVGNEIVAESFNADGKDATALLDSAEQKVLALSEQLSQSTSSFVSLKHAIKMVQEEIDELKKNPLPEGGTRGISTGFIDIDRMTDGLHPGQLIIIAGRPSMGKTAFALNIAANVARNSLPVGIFSLEMRAEELATRLISAVGRIPQDELKSGKISDQNWTRFYEACEDLVKDNINMQIDPSSSLTLFNIRSRARQLKVRFGKLGLIVVDYLQLMSSDNSRANENRATEVATISRGLKTLARELEVPVIALSQLSRKVEERRDNKRPMMSDLRESGAIEQDADVIIFLHREAVYEMTPENEKQAEVIIGKQRSGPTGVIEMVYEGQYTLFLNKMKSDWDQDAQE